LALTLERPAGEADWPIEARIYAHTTDTVSAALLYSFRLRISGQSLRLTLSPSHGSDLEHLYGVNVGSEQYWVHERDKKRIEEPGEGWLRQVSLKKSPASRKSLSAR
jgi:hypothetical protein